MKTQILDSIQNRFSPMNFLDKKITKDQMETLLNAARSVSSCYNFQPWAFVYAHKGTEMYEKLKSFMIDYNQNWSSNADVLMVSFAQKISDNNEENYFAMFDLGQAMSAMAIQASYMGLQMHQLGGFDFAKVVQELKMPANFAVGSMAAIGYPGNSNELDEHSKERLVTNRNRKSLDEISGSIDFFEGKK